MEKNGFEVLGGGDGDWGLGGVGIGKFLRNFLKITGWSDN